MGPHSSKSKRNEYQVNKSSSTGMQQQPNRQNNNLSELAVITVIFNPVKYRSRYEHYHRFAAHMAQSGVQLYTVECIFESAEKFGLPRQDFEITQPKNPNHIQLRAPNIMWVKENLINIAVTRLPKYINYVAWIDGDIEFERSDWAQLTINELQRYPIVQLFELSYFLGPGGKKDILRRDYSFGYSIRHNKPIDPKNYDQWYAHPGYAWAMRRSAFVEIGGLPDFCIIGSGDLHFAFALLNRIKETLRPNLHVDYQNLAITWGHKVAQVAQNGINVSYVATNIYHHWHGNRNDRSYVDRWAILERHHFSPLNDLEKNDDSGLLRLTSKRNHRATDPDALERDIVAYFKSRNEDTNVKTNQVPPPQPPNKNKPYVAGKTQPNRAPAGPRPTGGATYNPRPVNRNPIWSSGPHGTHVDDPDPFWDQCRCPGHHHCHDNHDCPCSPNHYDDQQCWDHPEDNYHHDDHHDDHHHHHDHDDHHHHHNDHDDHHHHHDHDDHHHHHEDHHHHDDHHYHHDDHYHHEDHSAGHQDYGNTDYSGPGGFY